MEIRNCIALVTGANRGLGKAFTELLVEAGAAKVYAGARHPGSISGGDHVKPIPLDVTRETYIAAAAASCTDVTLVINNAGVMQGSPILGEGSEEALQAE